MADFKLGVPHETETSTIAVDVGPSNPLPVGRHRFQLVVVDNEGNESEPAFAEMIVKSVDRPTAVLDAAPDTVEVGKSFTLSGRRSTDVPPGRIVKFIWTRLS